MNYGAFVEVLPGVEGLLHVTELGGQKVRHPREAVSESETVEVRVLELDPERKRLSLSRRLDPATDLPEPAPRPRLEVGTAVVGKVSNVKPYGVFVRIHEPVSGVDGLLPADETHLEHGADLVAAFPPGTTVEAEVLRIDERGRIRLTQRSAEERTKTREHDGARPRAEGGRGGERGHDGPRGGRRDRDRDRDRDRERDSAEAAGEGERRESKVAAGFGIMANAFKRVLDGRG
jgi:predicted RNA-binding protein with RPS1 domain